MNENKVQLLSIKEEKALPENDLKDYYARLREYVLNRELQTTT